MNIKSKLKQFDERFGKDYKIKSEPKSYIHRGVNSSMHIIDVKRWIERAFIDQREDILEEIIKIAGKYYLDYSLRANRELLEKLKQLSKEEGK